MQPHLSRFSLKAFLLSLIVLLATLLLAWLRLDNSEPFPHPRQGLVLSFQEDGIQIQTPYQTQFRPATSGEMIWSGSIIKTAATSSVELKMGPNKIHVEGGTTLKIEAIQTPLQTEYVSSTPALVLSLERGSVWIKAEDTIQLKLPHAQANLAQTMAWVDYDGSLNQVAVVRGNAELIFKEQEQTANAFDVPLYNQIAFLDNQINDNFSRLKPSKIKKELQMSPVAQVLWEHPWLQTSLSELKTAAPEFTSHSTLSFTLQNQLQKALSLFSFRAEAQKSIELAQWDLTLNYLMANIDLQDRLDAKKRIDDWAVLLRKVAQKPQVQTSLVTALRQVQQAEFGTSLYLLKEAILSELETSQGPVLFRIHLSDFEALLKEQKIQSAEVVLDLWQSKWTDQHIFTHFDEYKRQLGILNEMLLLQVDQISSAMLGVFDQAGEKRMQFDADGQEAQYEVVEQRLQMATALANQFRYALAKQYLKSSYLNLEIEALSQNSATRELFFEKGILLAQRLDFALKNKQDSSTPFDETAFRNYLDQQARDQVLVEDLNTLLGIERNKSLTEDKEEDVASLEQVVTKLGEGGFKVEAQNVTLINSMQNTFQLSGAELMDSVSENGTPFDAEYSYIENAFLNLKLEGQTFKGPVLLEDLKQLLQSNPVSEFEDSVPDLDQLLTNSAELRALEDQAQANDIATQLALKQLKEEGIEIIDPKTDIELTDSLNLNLFKVHKALLKTEGSLEENFISFDYNTDTQIASHINPHLTEAWIIESVALPEIREAVLKAIQRSQEAEESLESLKQFLEPL